MSREIILRQEQVIAVEQTLAYWQAQSGPREFLWNAKPRFGKTIASYEFIHQIPARRVLIVTNRPAVSDSWRSDFFRYLAPKSEFIFAMQRPSNIIVDDKECHIHSRAEIINHKSLLRRPIIFFISLQDLKGKSADSSEFKEKNQWIFDLPGGWDLLIIDEGHEGVQTEKWNEVFANLKNNFTLILSGTPFRLLADARFGEEQIYHYTYLDEQKDYPSDSVHLHFELIARRDVDYLANVFSSRPRQFQHSLWLLDTVAECRELANQLSVHPYFHSYHVVLAAGKRDGVFGEKSLAAVRSAISSNSNSSRTITLSCGQLTTGVTVPEWSSVVMLQNSGSTPTSYLQAAFRAQTPFAGKREAVVLDSSPERVANILQEYAKNLCSYNSPSSKDLLAELLRYINVSSTDENLHTHKLSSAEILATARTFVAREIVAGKFQDSNRLFRDFSELEVSPIALGIISKFHSAYKNRFERTPRPLDTVRISSSEENEPSNLVDVILNQDEASAESFAIASLNKLPEPEHPRSHHRASPPPDPRDKLRGFSRTVPLLLHAYADLSTSNAWSLDDLVKRIPDTVFTDITGVKPSEFQVLLDDGYFNSEYFDLAIREFLSLRNQLLTTYYLPESTDSILDYIPQQANFRVFTPPRVARMMIDKITDPAVFANPNTKFFDPAAKSGVFLAEIVRRCFAAQRSNFKSDRACLRHILRRQIYAWCPDETTYLATINSLGPLGEEAKASSHIIIFDPVNDKGGIGYERARQKLAKEWGEAMKFDVIIGNPPYQQGRRQIYADFYKLAVDLNPEYLCMIFPLGWQKTHSYNGLGQLNNAYYKRDPHIVNIDHYYENSRGEKIFPEIGTGGVNIVLRNRNFNNHGKIQKLEYGQPIGTMQLPLSDNEIVKPSELVDLTNDLILAPKIYSLGTSRKPYGLAADALRSPGRYGLTINVAAKHPTDVRLFGLLDEDTRGYRFLARRDLPRRTRNIDAFKLFTPKAWGNMSEKVGLGGSYANIVVARPSDVCTETFIEFGPFASQADAIRMAKYFMTKFFRALLYVGKTSQNTPRDKYRFVPLPDLSADFWNNSIAEIDEQLFINYDVPETTRKFIRNNIQSRNETNIEIL